MKFFKTIAVCALSAMILASCQSNPKPLPGITQQEVDSVSVAVGVAFANMLRGSQLDNINLSKVMSTIKTVLKGDTVIFTDQTAPMYIQQYMMKANEALGVL